MANFKTHIQIPNVLTKEQLQALLQNLIPSVGLVDNNTIVINNNQLTVNDLDDKVKSGIKALLDPETLAFSEDKLGVVTTAIFNKIYPVGSIYENANVKTNPKDLLGFGTWESFGAGKVLVGIDPEDNDFKSAGQEDGEKEVTLSRRTMPPHSHILTKEGTNAPSNGKGFDTGVNDRGNKTYTSHKTSSVGGGQPHNNLQPYIVVYRWVRTE